MAIRVERVRPIDQKTPKSASGAPPVPYSAHSIQSYGTIPKSYRYVYCKTETHPQLDFGNRTHAQPCSWRWGGGKVRKTAAAWPGICRQPHADLGVGAGPGHHDGGGGGGRRLGFPLCYPHKCAWPGHRRVPRPGAGLRGERGRPDRRHGGLCRLPVQDRNSAARQCSCCSPVTFTFGLDPGRFPARAALHLATRSLGGAPFLMALFVAC